MVLQISCVIVRLFAVYYLMQNAYFVSLISFFSSENVNANVQLHYIITVLNLFACLILIFKPQAILFGLRLSDKNVDGIGIDLSNRLQSAGIALLGLFFLLDGLQGSLNSFIYTINSDYGSNLRISREFWSDIIGIAGGIILVLSSIEISRLITWLRELRPQVDPD